MIGIGADLTNNLAETLAWLCICYPLMVNDRGRSVWPKESPTSRRVRILAKRGYASAAPGLSSHDRLYEITRHGLQALAAYDRHYLMQF